MFHPQAEIQVSPSPKPQSATLKAAEIEPPPVSPPTSLITTSDLAVIALTLFTQVTLEATARLFKTFVQVNPPDEE
ncbi:MAG: hypothetical protein AB4042_15965 [Leptolyngbyaceae cyanobacterium]